MEVNERGVAWQMKALLLSPDSPRQHTQGGARGDDSARFLLLILCSGGNRPAPFVETGAPCVQPVTCLKHKAPNGEWIRNPLLLLSGDSENQLPFLAMSILWSRFVFFFCFFFIFAQWSTARNTIITTGLLRSPTEPLMIHVWGWENSMMTGPTAVRGTIDAGQKWRKKQFLCHLHLVKRLSVF